MTVYRPTDGDFKSFHSFMKDIHSIFLKSNKLFYANGDFNLNILYYNKNEKVAKFLNLKFEYVLVAISNKPTSVTKNTNSISHRTINRGIIQPDILDHVAIF